MFSRYPGSNENLPGHPVGGVRGSLNTVYEKTFPGWVMRHPISRSAHRPHSAAPSMALPCR